MQASETERMAEIEREIKGLKTKYGMRVLEALYECPYMRQIDISRKIQIPASNLQGIMKKIMQTNPALIICLENQTGGKAFCLTEATEDYLDIMHGKNPENPVFRKWIRVTGQGNWNGRLYAALEQEEQLSDEEEKAFRDLVDYMKENDIQDAKLISDNFQDVQLFDKLLEYIHREDSVVYAVKPLAELYKNEWQAALSLIDYIFQHHFYNKLGDDYKIYKAFGLENEEIYLKIKWVLEKIVLESLEFCNKEEIYQNLEAQLGECEQLAFYIAEKINAGRDKIKVIQDDE